MKYILSAFILSIIIHLSLLYTIKNKKVEISDKPSSSKKVNKSSVHFVRLMTSKKIEPKKIEKKQVKEVKTIKPKELKKVKKIVKEAKREVIKKEPKKIVKKIPKKTTMPTFAKVNPTKLQKKTALEMEEEPLNIKMLDELTQSYLKLYGEEYNSFTKIQKVYLQKNLNIIGRITERYLRYPNISVKMRQQGLNVIEFVLYPNGDISTPLITSSSGHNPLDKNTLETIQIAYKDYPRPKEPTKIKIFVTYRLY